MSSATFIAPAPLVNPGMHQAQAKPADDMQPSIAGAPAVSRRRHTAENRLPPAVTGIKIRLPGKRALGNTRRKGVNSPQAPQKSIAVVHRRSARLAKWEELG